MPLKWFITSQSSFENASYTFADLSMGMGFLWESQGKRPMGWDRHKLLWVANGTDKYVPWTTLCICVLFVVFFWLS